MGPPIRNLKERIAESTIVSEGDGSKGLNSTWGILVKMLAAVCLLPKDLPEVKCKSNAPITL